MCGNGDEIWIEIMKGRGTHTHTHTHTHTSIQKVLEDDHQHSRAPACSTLTVMSRQYTNRCQSEAGGAAACTAGSRPSCRRISAEDWCMKCACGCLVGSVAASNTSTATPLLAKSSAAVKPTGPAPTTTTSVLESSSPVPLLQEVCALCSAARCIHKEGCLPWVPP
jgi:hypothetical protein